MAVTQLTDLIIVGELFNTGMIQQSITLDALIQSGIAFVDPEVNEFLNGPQGGKTYSKRFINALGEDESNQSSDDPASDSAPQKLSGGKETLLRHSRNESFSSMDLTAALYGPDPLGAVQSQLSKYWMTQRQKILMNSLVGLIADNVANDSGDMINDITAVGDGSFTGTGFVDALVTLGDRMGIIGAVAVHSIVMARLLKSELIDYVLDSEGKATVPTYMGKRVIMDDAMPVDANGGDPIFTSVLFGMNSVAIGNGAPKVPVEVKRDPAAGDGGGQETIFSRVELACHPVGFTYTGTTHGTNGESPTWAQLAAAASWDRVHARKRIPMAVIKTKA